MQMNTNPAAVLNSPAARAKRAASIRNRALRRRAMVTLVLRGRAQGISDKFLIEMFEMTRATYTNMIYREQAHCGVGNIVQLVLFYIRQGYITAENIKAPVTVGELHAARNMTTLSD